MLVKEFIPELDFGAGSLCYDYTNTRTDYFPELYLKYLLTETAIGSMLSVIGSNPVTLN